MRTHSGAVCQGTARPGKTCPGQPAGSRRARQDTPKVPLPPVAGAGQCQASRIDLHRYRYVTTYHHGPLLTRPAQVERLELECDRDAETGHIVRWYQPRKES